MPENLLPYLNVLLPSLSGACAVAILMVYILRWRAYPLFRKFITDPEENAPGQGVQHVTPHNICAAREARFPAVSIVVPARNQADRLEKLLPALFTQDYPEAFEVIVVDQKSTDDTPLLLKRQEQTYPHLRHSYVPATSRHIELRKLAVTLGIKAAYNEWVIVVNPDTIPASAQWLREYAAFLKPEYDFVEAYFNYDDNYSCIARRAIVERLRRFCFRLRAFRNGRVIGCEPANYAVRKEWFITQKGFADSLTLPFGEEYIFATRHADPARCRFLCSESTKLLEELPSRRELKAQRVRNAEVTRLLRHDTRRYRWQESLASSFLFLALLSNLLYAACLYPRIEAALPYGYFFLCTDIMSLLCWLLLFTLPALLLRKSAAVAGEHFFLFYPLWFEIMQPFRNVLVGLSRRFRHTDFRRKYLS